MIEKQRDFFVVRLNSSLYREGSIIAAFEELRKEKPSFMEKDGSYFVIKIKKSDGAEQYAYDFVNYVLKLMKNLGEV